tara:strand:+ start:1381 stop:1620 length:240 start_codon:yes stop_codon:yes gene_type:complete
MKFDTNVDAVFAINKKAHAVIMSCTNSEQMKGAINFVDLVERFYTTVECHDNSESSYLVKSIKNIRSVLKIQIKKLKVV